MDLTVRHATTYQYPTMVDFGPHRLMLRPRDSFDMRILDTSLQITPAAHLEWIHDVYGNPVAIATFSQMSDRLEVVSKLVLRRYASTLPNTYSNSRQSHFTPRYTDGERIVLQPYLSPATDDDGRMAEWMAAVLAQAPAESAPLTAVFNAIHTGFGYSVRYEEGTQDPITTIAVKAGSCRDLAWLFIEAARRLGYAARFITGYLHDSVGPGGVRSTVGFTHAWAEVFIPGDGWVEFDPTNALVADPNLIRVAMARVPGDASPISGSFVGPAGTSAALFVGVEISAAEST
ncbi:transglutaminase family protein [Phreatobacter aquaticus]|nr:transglutaminase family protein [Phreatobacter aquaticus]